MQENPTSVVVCFLMVSSDYGSSERFAFHLLGCELG